MRRLWIGWLAFIVSLAWCHAQSKPFYFIQITDPQFGMLENNESFTQETALMERAVAAVNRLEPAFVVVTGDLVNDGRNRAQLDEFKRVMGLMRKEIPVYLLPGNHDLLPQPTDEIVDSYIGEYGYDHFAFRMNNVCFIGLNTSLIVAGGPEREAAQRVWLEKTLKEAMSCERRVLFGHYPFFLEEPEEETRYQNLPAERRQAYLDLADKYRVSDMFAGHLHYNLTNSYKDFKTTVTSSVCVPLGEDKVGFRIVKVYPDRIVSEYYDLEHVPEKVRL